MEEREARRKKIAKRGSDRLALITGRTQTLNPSDTSPLSSPLPANSLSSLISPSPLPSPVPSPLPTSISDHSLLPPLPNSNRSHFRNNTEGDVPAESSMEHSTGSKFSRGNAFKYRSKPEIQIPKAQAKSEEQPLVRTPKASKSKSTHNKAAGKDIKLFTAKEINSCIVATESLRVFCSVVIALLVVLSNVNLVNSTSTIASRPLYILLLSNVTIVVLKVMQKQRAPEKAEEEMKLCMLKDGPNWDGAVQILEVGLAVYQTIRALFIDISCYMVVVVCGLPGWLIAFVFATDKIVTIHIQNLLRKLIQSDLSVFSLDNIEALASDLKEDRYLLRYWGLNVLNE